MALSDVGESDIIYCEHCKYAADEEKAQAKLDGYHHTIEEKGMELVLTPNKKTIDEVSEFLKLSKKILQNQWFIAIYLRMNLF